MIAVAAVRSRCSLLGGIHFGEPASSRLDPALADFRNKIGQ
jgi:hypothetical protein